MPHTHIPQRGKVIVGMSGGVDSAVAAYLLREAGLEVVGVTLRTWTETDNRCCEIGRAQETARQLGIRYYPHNMLPAFRERVVMPFCAEYLRGHTPNPCVECNRYVKWTGLINLADTLSADYVATGHYARIVALADGRLCVGAAADERKDQSYMLYRLTKDQLARTILPLGELTKEQVREIARKANLAVRDAADSQEICFVGEGDYASFVQNMTKNTDAFTAGNFVDEGGNIVGRHCGIARYTVGQRKGLNLALGRPVYVKKICAATNEVVIADDADLYASEIFCRRLSFASVDTPKENGEFRALVRIRYHHKGEYALVKQKEKDLAQIVFDSPVRAPAPGQSAVFYDENSRVLGGGIIV